MRRPLPVNLRELEIRAEALAGRTVAEVARAANVVLPPSLGAAKGFVGQLAEQILGADPAAYDSPDFSDLGVELKTIPIGRGSKPSESTFVCGISLRDAEHDQWRTSRLFRRLQHVLWLPVEGREVEDLGARRFGRPVFWQPTAAEEARLQADWTLLMGMVGAGQTSQIDARLGEVLQIRPKAPHSRARTRAPSDEGFNPALPIGFYLRARFTAEIVGVPNFEPGIWAC